MSHSHVYESIVLRTYDVGEADRFCILFTRERGRVAARANGVRKPTSRMGGSLLPFQHVTVHLKETNAGWFLASVAGRGSDRRFDDLQSFTTAQEGVELLLALIQDDEPLPDVFDATLAFLDACLSQPDHLMLAYAFRVLHCLGLLPDPQEIDGMHSLEDQDHAFLLASLTLSFETLPPLASPSSLRALRDAFLLQQLSSPLRVPGFAAALQ